MTSRSPASASLIRLTVRRAREERLAQAAGSLTFTTLLSVVPLLAVSFALFNRFAAPALLVEQLEEVGLAVHHADQLTYS